MVIRLVKGRGTKIDTDTCVMSENKNMPFRQTLCCDFMLNTRIKMFSVRIIVSSMLPIIFFVQEN